MIRYIKINIKILLDRIWFWVTLNNDKKLNMRKITIINFGIHNTIFVCDLLKNDTTIIILQTVLRNLQNKAQ